MRALYAKIRLFFFHLSRMPTRLNEHSERLQKLEARAAKVEQRLLELQAKKLERASG